MQAGAPSLQPALSHLLPSDATLFELATGLPLSELIASLERQPQERRSELLQDTGKCGLDPQWRELNEKGLVPLRNLLARRITEARRRRIFAGHPLLGQFERFH